MKQHIILLATDDSAVEIAVKSVSSEARCVVDCAHDGPQAISMLIDRGSENAVAVVDLDLPHGGRSLLRTAGGTLPVIAITGHESAWLDGMLHHHRIAATLRKPVEVEALRGAMQRLESSLARGE